MLSDVRSIFFTFGIWIPKENPINRYSNFDLNGLEVTMFLVFDGYLAWPITHRDIA